MNIFKKKFIPIETYQKKVKNKNHNKNDSLIKRTNSLFLFENKDNNEIKYDLDNDNTIHTKSLKNTVSDDALYLEQKNYDIESSKNIKNISKVKDNTSSMNENNSNYNLDEYLKYKMNCDNSVKRVNLSKNKIIPKSNSYYKNSSSNKEGDKNSNTYNFKKYEQSSKSSMSESITNFNDLNLLNHGGHNKKGLIYNYNQMNNYIKNNNQKNKKYEKEYKSQSYSKYIDVIKNGRNYKKNNFNYNNIKNNDTTSTNEFTKLKSKYMELKNEHDLTLSKLKKEKKKNKQQKEEIEYMINNIKSGEKKENTLEEMNKIIKQLKEENETFRQELVLSQALINSLKSELKNNNINKNIFNNSNNKIIEDISQSDKSENNKLNRFKVKYAHNVDDLIKEINELNYALNKKNEILDSVLIENKKLRNELKYNIKSPEKDNKLLDLIYKDAKYLINKYIKYRNNNKEGFNNLILTEKFFNDLEKLKSDFSEIKNSNSNNADKIVELYLSLIRSLSNEFDKLLLYNNNFEREKYINKYKRSNNSINKSIEFNFDKQKYNLMDLCLLSSSYIKGYPKDLVLEGINLIKNLEILYKERNNIEDSDEAKKEKINDLIMRQENQLDNIKRKLSYNQSNYNRYLSNSNSTSNIKNIFGLTYMTNYINSNNNNNN